MGDSTLPTDGVFGFIVIYENETLFGTLSGNTPNVLDKYSAQIGAEKHARGGESARIGAEKRNEYLRKTAELATLYYVNPSTGQPNVTGLILAGSADLKTELKKSPMFDSRLAAKILSVVNVSSGGHCGFTQAIARSSEILGDVRFFQEKRLIRKFLDELSQDTGKIVFGVRQTMDTLVSKLGAIETLIVWQDLAIDRCVLLNNLTGETEIKYTDSKQRRQVMKHHESIPELRVGETARPLRLVQPGNSGSVVVQVTPLREWLVKEHTRFGCALQFVNNKSHEGAQFCGAFFQGVGGILKEPLFLVSMSNLKDPLFPYQTAQVVEKEA